VHLDGLHCLLAYFPGLICHYLVSKIIIKKINFFFKKLFSLFYFLLLAIIVFCILLASVIL